MADSAIFSLICEELTDVTGFNTIAARGTVRLALKEAGLDAQTVNANQMKVVLEKILPGELRARGIKNENEVCGGLLNSLNNLSGGTQAAASPQDIFRRLAGEIKED